MFKNEEYSSLIYMFYIPTRCLFAGTDKERPCVSKIIELIRTTIQLFRDCVIVYHGIIIGNDEGEARINYHLIEIESE